MSVNDLFEDINRRYINRKVIPFARTLASDDVACFVIEEVNRRQGEVIVVHDYALFGTEVEARFPTFWEWFKFAVDQMIRLSEQ